ncbi:hypothetical protein [Actinomycetospora termitidis]|uniref:Uncharacterized protein n=1 Tax=Actinomycetospora termitidis TaxID=3053470 RepID=A0ABT7MGW1_9PSEU|nr:hypothetical protein [Actinomycetospora sp. Odt1-22]MDL5159404.1 hypothetical protein [Actinomycetospora sp. Odt1-22]
MSDAVDVRCPVNPGRLFMRLRQRDPDVQVVQPGNVLEVKCRDCTKARGRDVVHTWNVLGEYLGDL